MITNLQPFIDAGWYTLPLKGALVRLDDGTKTIPKFEANWKDKYTQTRNTTPALIGGVITGQLSNVIAIDCDNELTYRYFRMLDPHNNALFLSKGKLKEGVEQVCGTILYSYHQDLDSSFSSKQNGLALDFMSTNRMVYLPTEANQSKCAINTVPELKPVPPEVLLALLSLQAIKPKSLAPTNTITYRANLYPLVAQFVESGKVDKKLFRIITPKDFRDDQTYIDYGYLHPKDIPDGRGSEYLSKISAILGADASISEDTYVAAMKNINGLFKDPMAITRLNSTVIEPMSLGKSTDDQGETIWRYDPDWDTDSLSFITKRGTMAHLFYDPKRTLYYEVDIDAMSVSVHSHSSMFLSHINAISSDVKLTKKGLEEAIPNVLVKPRPDMDFGFYGQDYFNTFMSTDAYKVFKSPEEYAPVYKRPTTILNFLETLIPDEQMRTYLVRFLRRKLSTMDYSPVILYFLGVPGSGKDTFVGLLRRILGAATIEKPGAKMFLEKHNAWLLDKIFVQLDEYGDSLSTYQQKEEALGLLKSYTGAPSIAVRAMREDVVSYRHNITFIMTANRNPLMLDQNDRRIALFHCTKPLTDEPWVNNMGGMEAVLHAFDNEIADFCYYLATEVENLDSTAYTTPPMSEARDDLIAESMSPQKRVAMWFKDFKWQKLADAATEYGMMDEFIENAAKNKIIEHTLVELVDQMTNGRIENIQRILHSAMREAGFARVRTTMGGNHHAYVYLIKGFKYILDLQTAVYDEEDFEYE